MFDAVSPWDAGRYHDNTTWTASEKGCLGSGSGRVEAPAIGYMPTAFPGFSWDNLFARPHHHDHAAEGEFYWRQFAIFKALGIRTVFVGMFDEVNEGTAIYKVANQTPVENTLYL